MAADGGLVAPLRFIDRDEVAADTKRARHAVPGAVRGRGAWGGEYCLHMQIMP